MTASKKIFTILEELCIDGDFGVSELSTRLSIGKSTIHRYLSILKDLGYVEQNEKSNKYYATLKTFELGSLVLSRVKLVKVARNQMEELSKKVHETINLALFEAGKVLYIDKIESAETLRMDLAVGRTVPAYCTALGKVFLSHLKDDELEDYLNNCVLKANTGKTITDASELKMHLKKVRKIGFAIDDRELDEGIRCIAAPIYDNSGNVAAALSISGPTIRMKIEQIAALSNLIKEVTRDISQKLGFINTISKK